MSRTSRARIVGGALAILAIGDAGWVMAAEPAASAEVRLSQGRSNTVALQSAGHLYVAVVAVRAVRSDDFLSQRAVGVKSQIANLTITADGKRVAVPLSAIADAYDPIDLRLVATKTGVTVAISGSDGADGYGLEVVIDGERVIGRRIVVAGYHVAEETHYHHVVVD